MSYSVYVITCSHPTYSKPTQYVGVVLTHGKTVSERFEEHCRANRRGSYLHNAIKKYGAEWFSIAEIETTETREQACERERFWIRELNTKAPHGFNLTDGGEGSSGRVVSDEQKVRVRSALIGIKRSEQTRKRISAAQKGKKRGPRAPHSEATRAKMSASRKGKAPHPVTAKQRESSSTRMKKMAHAIGSKGRHTRYHTNRGITNKTCVFCTH